MSRKQTGESISSLELTSKSGADRLFHQHAYHHGIFDAKPRKLVDQSGQCSPFHSSDINPMNIHGACKCGNCVVVAEGSVVLGELIPRICDCEYCQKNPSAVISHPNMTTLIESRSSIIDEFNGSGQATFYYCKSCKQMLAVGATIDGVTLGAINKNLFGKTRQFPEPILIHPWRLSPSEKIARWPKVWGRLKVSCV